MKHTLVAALASFVLVSSAAQAALLNSYDFDTLGRGDTLLVGDDLTDNGGTIAGGLYSFTDNQGLRLTAALPDTSNYGIELRFKVIDSIAGYNKLIDFQDLSSDFGLYLLEGTVDFFTALSTSGTVSLGEFVTVGLERSGGSISLFLDGAFLGTATDDSEQAVSLGNILNFFVDDTQVAGESFAGAVDFIRIHNDSSTFGQAPAMPAIPVPASLPMLLSGLGLLSLLRRAGSRQRA